MPRLFWMAAVAVAGMATVGLLLVGMNGGDVGVGKRGTLVLDSETEGVDDGAPADDKNRDTHAAIDSAASRDRAQRAGASYRDRTGGGTLDVSVDPAPTSRVTRGTVSGGTGTVDVAPTSGVTAGTVSGGTGTHDGSAGGGGGDSSYGGTDTGGGSTG